MVQEHVHSVASDGMVQQNKLHVQKMAKILSILQAQMLSSQLSATKVQTQHEQHDNSMIT